MRSKRLGVFNFHQVLYDTDHALQLGSRFVLYCLVHFPKTKRGERKFLALWLVNGTSLQRNVYFAHCLSFKEFFQRNTALASHFRRASEAGERRNCGFNHVVRVGRALRLGKTVMYPH